MRSLVVALAWGGLTLGLHGEPKKRGLEDFTEPCYFDTGKEVAEIWAKDRNKLESEGAGSTPAFPWNAASLSLLRQLWNGVQNRSTLTEYSYLCSQWFALPGYSLPEWTHMATDYEDGSSTHYYFYHSNGESIDRIRWVWNGGVQNAPEVIDYFLEAGSFQVIKSIGQRKSLPDLIRGLDVPLRETDQGGLEGIVSNSSTGYTKRSESQDLDLKILVDLLSKDRSLLGEKGPLK
ncbi:hypothetical protein AAFN60_16305 [Roseibacillus persicicus]|uniref:hypothetical protein n=1 Tax=Roseibacillus persicicus TaxID=454148 RepID=UPI00398B89B3